MSMVFCFGCGKPIHETAPTCPHCGGVQQQVTIISQNTDSSPVWLSIVSMILGIIGVLALFDNSNWDKDQILGLGIFSCGGLAFGFISLNNKMAGKGMAITGVVLSSITFLAFLGMLK